MSSDPIQALWARSQKEPYRKLMGIKVLDIAKGYAKTTLEVKPELSNVFGMLHGGAVFSLLDEAFQLACNAHGKVAVALELNIYYLAPAKMGGTLIAEVTESHRSNKIAHYEAKVYEEQGKVVARAHAVAFRKGHALPLDQDGNLTY